MADKENPMKNVHPYDVTAFYFANLKEEEMDSDEERLKEIKKLLNTPSSVHKINTIGELKDAIKFLLDLVEGLKEVIERKDNKIWRQIGRERETRAKIQQLETILEKAEVVCSMRGYWHVKNSEQIKDLKQAIDDYKKGKK